MMTAQGLVYVYCIAVASHVVVKGSVVFYTVYPCFIRILQVDCIFESIICGMHKY
jgi:hypothetical protein